MDGDGRRRPALAAGARQHGAGRPLHDDGRDGGYAIAGLPPGAYLFAAFPDGDTDDWPDRRVIAAAAKAAIRVELLEGLPSHADLPLRRLILEGSLPRDRR